MKKTLIVATVLAISLSSYSQTAPAIQWAKSFGGSGADEAFCGQQTTDGGYVMAGQTGSNNGDVTGNHGGIDFWVVKTDATGALQWQKSLGGSDTDYAESIQQTADGGYILAGTSTSEGGDITGNHGDYDMWVAKLGPDGDLQWQRSLGGSGSDYGYAVRQDNAGNYWIAGGAASTDGDVTGNHGSYSDFWLVKLNSTGGLLWEKCYGGSYFEEATSIDLTADGGCILEGIASSADGDITGFHGGEDIWVVKVDSVGILEWQHALGSSDWDLAGAVKQTDDGGYIVSGNVKTNDGDASGTDIFEDAWAVKLDSAGAIQWQKIMGGSGSEDWNNVQQTNDGGFILSGSFDSTDGDVPAGHGAEDGWLVKLDSVGTLQWQKALGGGGFEAFADVHQTNDGGFILVGSSDYNGGDVTGNHGADDFWMVKLGPENVGIPELEDIDQFSFYPNPSTSGVNIDLDLKAAAAVRLQLYDDTGKLVATVLDEKSSAGDHRIRYSTQGLPAGLYELRLTAGGSTTTRSLVKE